jgi:hypothetical protein
MVDTPQTSALRDQTLFWEGQLRTYRALEGDLDVLNNNQTVKSYFDNTTNGIIGILQNTQRLFDGGIPTSDEAISAKALVQQQTYDFQAAQNWADILTMQLDWVINGTTASPTEIDWIRNLAAQCPYDEGVSVYTARQMLVEIDGAPTVIFNPCEASPAPPNAKMAWETATENEDDLDETVFAIYPNPNKGEFTITGENIDKVEVYNTIGSLVDTYNPQNNKLIITGLSKGVYLVKAYDQLSKSFTERVVVY